MANTGLKNKILALSPFIEIIVRNIYWRHKSIFSRLNSKRLNSSKLNSFEKIIFQLHQFGLQKGDILMVHSSYEQLENTGKSPKNIIDDLINLIGDEGTLVMNSSRIYPEEKIKQDYINAEYHNEIVTYDVYKSKVWTGVLPFFMLRDKRSRISKFPINPVVAIGKHAAKMIEKNISEEYDYPCGINSSWKFCVDNNALIIGLGVDLTHNLTIMHVAEDIMGDNWPIKNWYRNRKFRIIDSKTNFDKIINVKERNPKWGALHFAERTFCKDLLNEGILKTVTIDGVIVEAIRANELICFLNSKNKAGYPYFNL